MVLPSLLCGPITADTIWIKDFQFKSPFDSEMTFTWTVDSLKVRWKHFQSSLLSTANELAWCPQCSPNDCRGPQRSSYQTHPVIPQHYGLPQLSADPLRVRSINNRQRVTLVISQVGPPLLTFLNPLGPCHFSALLGESSLLRWYEMANSKGQVRQCETVQNHQPCHSECQIMATRSSLLDRFTVYK